MKLHPISLFWIIALQCVIGTALIADEKSSDSARQDIRKGSGIDVLLISDTTEGFVPLFDGKTLTGWVQRGGKAKYAVEDGMIIGSTAANTKNSFLCTEKDYGDFILELDFKTDPSLNSGVQIRSESKPDYKNGIVHGYQVEIDPSARAWTGGIYDEQRRLWLVKLDKDENEAARKAFKQNEWNHFRIEAVGDSIKTWLNGVSAAELKDSMTLKGFIALQVHQVGGKEEPLYVYFKNVRIKEISPKEKETQ